MELRDYVRAKRRWLVPLVVAPLLVAAVTALVLSRQPARHTAFVTLQVPSSSANSDSQIGLYVARLAQAVRLPDVRQAAIDRSGIDIAELKEPSVARIAQSDAINLTLTTTAGPDATLSAAEALALEASVRLVGPGSAGSGAEFEAAAQVLSDAQVALLDFQAEIGTDDPAAAYQAVSSSMRTAESQLEAAQGAGDEADIQAAQARIDALERQRGRLIEQIKRFDVLQGAVDAARQQLTNAQQKNAVDQAQRAAARSGEQIVESVVVPEPRIRPVIEGAGLAAALTFLALLGISLLPDLLRRQRPASGTLGGGTAGTGQHRGRHNSPQQTPGAPPRPERDDAGSSLTSGAPALDGPTPVPGVRTG